MSTGGRCRYCGQAAGREADGAPAVVCRDCEPIAEMEWERNEARDVALCVIEELPADRQAYYRSRGYAWLEKDDER